MPELSHARAHIQGSDAAYSQFDALIQQIKGTIIYDSSLSRASDVKDYLIKAEKSGKALKVSDITRNDTARALAVLSRPVKGDDPRVPLDFVLVGAERDRQQRPECMNAVLYPQRYAGDLKITQEHRYELFGCNRAAADRRLLITLGAAGEVQWGPNEDISEKEAKTRMKAQGIRWDNNSQKFLPVNPKENWKDELKKQLDKPVGKLIQSLNAGERKVRSTVFSKRTMPLISPAFSSPAELYEQLDQTFVSCISKDVFIKAFDVITSKSRVKLINDLQLKASQGQTLSYLDLPATVAFSLHAELTGSPWPETSD